MPARAGHRGLRIVITGRDLPGRSCGPSPDRPAGYGNIMVGVQRRGNRDELLGVVPGDAPQVTWTLDVTVKAAADGGADLAGPHIQGPPGGRFIYLNWGTADRPGTFELFRRAKIWLNAVPAEVLRAAVEGGVLVGSLGLTDAAGHPLCASVRPPLIEWSAASASRLTPASARASHWREFRRARLGGKRLDCHAARAFPNDAGLPPPCGAGAPPQRGAGRSECGAGGARASEGQPDARLARLRRSPYMITKDY